MPDINLIFFIKAFADCKNTNKTAKNIARLTAGRVSKRVIKKLCQYVATDEKSENIKEKKLRNPDWLKSDKSTLRDGINPSKDPDRVTEKMTVRLKNKMRSSL